METRKYIIARQEGEKTALYNAKNEHGIAYGKNTIVAVLMNAIADQIDALPEQATLTITINS